MAASVGCTSTHQKGPANILNNSSFRSELLEVAHHLKNEKSFVGNEKENIKKLYSLVDNSSMKVHQLNMSVHQQRCLLNDLITGSCRVTPQICCSRFNSLSKANFIDGYKFLTHHELRVGRFLKSFRGNPKLVALCISELESSKEACCVEHFVRVVMLQLYEGLITHEDEVLAGRMLQHLFLFQIQKHSTNSLKHFLKSETAFNIAYRLYTECLSSSKTFLTAAFHSPTISLLSEDEWYFDVDVSSCIARLGPAEALRRFGQASSEDYDVKVKVHHTRLMDKLVYFTKLFIESLKSCHSIFPKSLARIFKNIYKVFSTSQHLSQQQQQDGNHNEANWDKALLNMVLNSFICLAICDPQFGGVVSDTPISEVSRHNLRQIAHIIQNLCLSTVDDVDVPACELYDKFDKV
ncbi:hypothetical protein HELRODRAFT_64951 [Helobdella robusta]|uniref:Ras-GAP domain-containing protein n=1 Tax=Helobdella robusta TaxID=6412 RepID=T1FY20_HELRO|nr:hypothetical protein HELRODRAFT_64951 [Helobdella robusta]ESO06286.1 hypothetical protein HELRODRAFT_64951 [Helobdella robusta]